jgi:hypothetical protein
MSVLFAASRTHPIGKLQKRCGNRTPDMDERGHDHDASDDDAERDQPKCLPVGDAEPLAGGLRISDRLIGQLTERVARRLIGRARCTAIERLSIGFAIRTRERRDLVDQCPVFVPVLLEHCVQIILGGIAPDALEVSLGLRDRAVELGHLAFGLRQLGRSGRQKVAALDGAEIGGEIVEVAERPGIGQPHFRHVSRQQAEVAQAPDAERSQHDDQQKEQQEHRGEVKPDRLRLPHGLSILRRNTPAPLCASGNTFYTTTYI